ncbi:hypothetical protein [Sulfurospirillum oryzae]|uniref:hypothetical protein n=1 Tax=Sulfurospirillum oryzae TaxID=2976535 RepID=UPI0021E8A6F5|nr:hypothetical protein [Sulfurospirillum oryzae]
MQETKVFPHFLKQAYQAEVLLRKPQIHSVGTRYPYKDHVVITTENIERSAKNPLFSIISLIDVVVKCENRTEAVKLNMALKEYFAKGMMLPFYVGVFQKPYTKKDERSMKYYAFANISAKELLEELPKLEKNKDLKYVVGATPVESNYILNGFDLTYSLTEYTMQGSFMTLEQMKELNKNAEKPSYKLKLCTTSFYEVNEEIALDESINFEISGESESEIETLAEKIVKLQNNGIAFTCKGKFPQQQKDYYIVAITKKAGDLITEINAMLEPKNPTPTQQKAS